MKELERQLKALANRRRLAILKYIKENRAAKVGDIADEINLSFAATSRHLNLLAERNILDKEQKSLEMHYGLKSNLAPAVKYVISLL